MGPPVSQHQQPAVRVRSDEFPVSSDPTLQISIVDGGASVAENAGGAGLSRLKRGVKSFRDCYEGEGDFS